jgi:hypothetical protein
MPENCRASSSAGQFFTQATDTSGLNQGGRFLSKGGKLDDWMSREKVGNRPQLENPFQPS